MLVTALSKETTWEPTLPLEEKHIKKTHVHFTRPSSSALFTVSFLGEGSPTKIEPSLLEDQAFVYPRVTFAVADASCPNQRR